MQLNSEVIYLVGNKTDLIEDRKISYAQGKKVIIKCTFIWKNRIFRVIETHTFNH